MATKSFPTITPGWMSLPIEVDVDWQTIVTPTEMGQYGTRDEYTRALRTFKIPNKIISQRNEEIILGFYNEVRNTTEFNWTSSEKVVSPWEAPTLTSGGVSTLGARTLYVVYTWGDGTYETLYSQEASQAVGNTELLSVNVPWFLPSVTQCNIYIGTVSGTLHRVATLSTDGGTWTEAETAVNGDSASGQKVLNVTSSTGFVAGDYIVINSGGGREEIHEIDTVGVGTITVTQNLTYTHTALDGDKVNHDYTSGASPPTSNNFTEIVEVKFSGKPRWIRNSATNYQFLVTFREHF